MPAATTGATHAAIRELLADDHSEVSQHYILGHIFYNWPVIHLMVTTFFEAQYIFDELIK